MSLASKYNVGSFKRVEWDLGEITDYEFVPKQTYYNEKEKKLVQGLYDLIGEQVMILKGCYITKTDKKDEATGESILQPVLITEVKGKKYRISATKNYLPIVKAILSSEEDIASIKNGEVGCHLRMYHNDTIGKDLVAIDLDDLLTPVNKETLPF